MIVRLLSNWRTNTGVHIGVSAERENHIDAGVRANAHMWYRRFHYACILLTPLIQWYVNPNLFVTQAIGWLDPWVYTGYFLSLPSHLRMFGDTYYAGRLAWLLPGFALHQMFSPVVATYVLHLSFLYALVFAVYHLVSTALNRRAGMLAAIMFGWNPTILAALSWDYVDGAGIVFIVLSLLCLERLSRDPGRKWGFALAAGASMAAIISSNLFLIVVWPVLTVFFLIRVGSVRWRSVAVALLLTGTGAAITLAGLGLVHARLGGSFLFLRASFRQTRELLTVPNIWRADSYIWVLQAMWLALPMAATIGALTTFGFRRRADSFAAAIHVSLLLTLGIWLLWEARGLPVLFIPYYASYLFPFSLLAILVQGPPISTDVDRRVDALLDLGTIGLFALAHWWVLSDATGFWSSAVQRLHLTALPGRFATGSSVGACLLAMTAWRLVNTEWLQRTIFATLLAVSYFAAPGNWPAAHAVTSSPLQLERTTAAHRFIRESIGHDKPRFWYYAIGSTQLPFTPIASTYLWGYVLINEDFPALTNAQAADLSVNTPLVLLVPSAEEVERGRPALGEFGLDYAIQAQKEFGTGDMSFVVAVAKLVFGDTEAGRRRLWRFREWQGENGAVVEREPATAEGARSTMKLPPKAYTWTAADSAQSAPSGQYVASLILRGEGALTIRVLGLDRPWPIYTDCPVHLTPDGGIIECAFTKPANGMGVEIALMNNSNTRAVVSAGSIAVANNSGRERVQSQRDQRY